MKIKPWEYLAEYEIEREDILAAVDRVFRSGRLVLGESVASFEKEFSSYCGVAHGVGVDNATNGLFLSLKALGIGAGDEVITVANTAVPTVSAIVQSGATPRFVDIDPTTYLMDVSLVERAITPRTKCVLPVHLYGQCVDMIALRSLLKGKGIQIIEDCSQSHGASQHGAMAGSMSDLAVFSFYPTKPLGGYGDAGMIITDRRDLDAKLRRLRFYGMDSAYYSEEVGYNSRLDELHAEILRQKLRRLDGYLAKRRQIAAEYDRALSASLVTLPATAPGNDHVYYVYVCRYPARENLLAALQQNDIQVAITYPWPIHTMRGFAWLGYGEGDLPNTEAVAREIFSLPVYPTLAEADQSRICAVLTDCVGTRLAPSE
jgi:aminotransferase EvaB